MTSARALHDSSPFPRLAVAARLRSGLEEAAAESDVLRADWEPILDSLRVVSIVANLEELLGFRLPPDRVVRRGGYSTVDEGVEDMLNRLDHLWQNR
jgi:acyl carrier protein